MSAATQIQKIANQTQIQLQKLVNSSNELQTKYNAQEAQKARDWQTNMSKTAHQMEVEDLKKAGLNPVLSSGGSGAQSYTTSSASATPESGAAALASLQGSSMGAISSIESSRIAAAAQRATASAMRYAAAQSAAAQIYAANKGYQKAQYTAKAQLKGVKYTADTNKWMSQFKQASSPWGLIDKYTTKAFKAVPGVISFNKFRGAAKSLNNKFVNNPLKYMNSNNKPTSGGFTLTASGKSAANNVLSRMGIAQTGANRKLVVQAYVFGNRNAISSLNRKIPRSYSPTTIRPGWR